MRLLICSFEFDSGAEGICTGRLVRALLDRGCQITLVTSDLADLTFRHDHLQTLVVPAPTLHWSVAGLLARLMGAPKANAIWCHRVATLRKFVGKPALIYGRAMPLSSVEAARRLAIGCGVPFWAHLSDPSPNPWVERHTDLFRRLRSHACRLARTAQALTFTTEQALAFQERCLGVDLRAKAFVLPHIGPAPGTLPRREDGAPTFIYIGSFYGKRQPDTLLDGFARHLNQCPSSRFVFLGTDPASIMPTATRLAVSHAVRIVGTVKDVRPWLAAADVLVAVDACEGEPVFMSTKLVEYLVVDRPILLLSPSSSPGAVLLQRFPSTTRRVGCEDPMMICRSMDELLKTTVRPEDYASRFEQMREFSAGCVASRFLALAEKQGLR